VTFCCKIGTDWYPVNKFAAKVDNDIAMIPIAFEYTRSKVKVAVTFSCKINFDH